MGIRRTLLLIVICLCLGASLSAVTIGPEITLNHNPLHSAASRMHLNTAPKVVRIDQQAQISSLFTSLIPAALEFAALETDAKDSMDMPESHMLDLLQVESSDPLETAFSRDATPQNIVNLMSLVLPSREMVAEIAKLVDPLEANRPQSVGSGNSSFPAASILALALSQRS